MEQPTPSQPPTTLDVIVRSALAAEPGTRRRGEEGLRASEKEAGHVARLTQCLATELAAPGHPSAAALFCAQALQKSLRRAGAAELESCGASLVDALRAAAERRWTAGLTQLALAAAVAMIRSADLSLLLAFDGQQSEASRCIALSLLTLLAEELHSPASRISAPPERPAHVRLLLRQSAPHTMAMLHTWFEQAAAAAAGGGEATTAQTTAADSAAAVLRAAGAWCVAGLVSGSQIAASALFTASAAAALQHPRAAPDAADALCSAIDVVSEEAAGPSRGSGLNRAGGGKGGKDLKGGKDASKAAGASSSAEPEDAGGRDSAAAPPLAGLRLLLQLASEVYLRVGGMRLERRHVAMVAAHVCEALAATAVAYPWPAEMALSPTGAVEGGASGATAEMAAAAASLEALLSQWSILLLGATRRLAPDDVAVALDAWFSLGELAEGEPSRICEGGGGGGGDRGGGGGGAAGGFGACLVARVVTAARPALLQTLIGSSLLPPELSRVTESERDAWLELREDQRAVMRAAVFAPTPLQEGEGGGEVVAQLWGWASAALDRASDSSSSSAEPAPWIVLEAALHAASAAAKGVGLGPCAPLAELVAHLPSVAHFAHSLIASPSGAASDDALAGRALLFSVLVLIGALAAWLGSAGSRQLPPLVAVLVWSLSVPEQAPAPWPAADWVLRYKQEHSGAVALSRLATLAPRALLADAGGDPGASSTAALIALAAALHAAAARARAPADGSPLAGRPGHSAASPLTRDSALLLLQALAAAAAAADAASAAPIASALLQPLCERFAAAAARMPPARAPGAPPPEPPPPVAEALACELDALGAVLRAWPPAFRAEGARALAPLAPTLAGLLTASERVARAACEAAAALFDGLDAHAAPLLPVLAPALVACFERAAADAADADAADAEQRDAALAAAAAARRGVLLVLRSVALRCGGDNSDAGGLAAALLRGVAERCAAPLRARSAAGASAEQAVLAQWLELCLACAGAPQAAALLAPCAPLLLETCTRLAAARPPGAAAGDESVSPDDLAGLKQALVLLHKAVPPTPLGAALHAALNEPAPTTALVPLAPCSRGGALVCALLVALSGWTPSWLLGDVATALWGMRNGHGEADFATWLQDALAPEGLPRPSLSAEAKAAFARQLLEAPNWSAFKAALKQLSGGKKKQGGAKG